MGEVDVPHTSIIILEPGKSIPVRKDAKSSQEVLDLMQGTLELKHGDEKVTLVEGDTVHLWTEQQRQSITNIGKTTSVLLWVGTL